MVFNFENWHPYKEKFKENKSKEMTGGELPHLVGTKFNRGVKSVGLKTKSKSYFAVNLLKESSAATLYFLSMWWITMLKALVLQTIIRRKIVDKIFFLLNVPKLHI